MSRERDRERDGRRGLRLSELVRERLAGVVRRELDDPQLSLLVVTRVKVSEDLSYIDVGTSFLGVDDDGERKRLLTRLTRAAHRVRRALGTELELRKTPELRFHADTGQDAAKRVDELLGEIAKERDEDEGEG
jgi:ribosome-binding factor A